MSSIRKVPAPCKVVKLTTYSPLTPGFLTVYSPLIPVQFSAFSRTVYSRLPSSLLPRTLPFTSGSLTVYFSFPNRLLQLSRVICNRLPHLGTDSGPFFCAFLICSQMKVSFGNEANNRDLLGRVWLHVTVMNFAQ